MGVGTAPRILDARAGSAARISPPIATRARPAPLPLRAVSARKRIFDFTLAGVAFVILAPLLLLIWCAVRATSPGPGVYWSPRSGRAGRIFMMPKFRTMQAAAPQRPREALENADTYITPVGRFLRRTSLDELPQLVSVMRGDMSLIGPRPLLPSDPAQLARQDYPETLAMRPGMSGLAQVRGRNLVSPRKKARLDAFYARVRSGWFDIEIIGRTLLVLVSGRGFI